MLADCFRWAREVQLDLMVLLAVRVDRTAPLTVARAGRPVEPLSVELIA